jgi:hypothetical protein
MAEASSVWARPRSLAATRGISFDFFSTRYLDVSVPWVGREQTMNSSAAGRYSLRGLSHSEISGSKPVSGSPKLFAAVHVLHRLSSPRHPPCALCSLTVPLRHASRLRPESEDDTLSRSSALCALLLRRTVDCRPHGPSALQLVFVAT